MLEDMESITAKLCCFARAYHAKEEGVKIFEDKYAYDLMGEDEYNRMGLFIEKKFDTKFLDKSYGFNLDTIKASMEYYIAPIPLSRSRFCEGELMNFSRDAGMCQYIICGSGLDTFSFRNSNSNIKIYEIDHPKTQEYKLDRIKKLKWNIPNNVKYVSVDFSCDNMFDKLLQSGYDTSIPTFFSILGVVYYLSIDDFSKTLESINKISTYASKLVFDFPDETLFDKNVDSRLSYLSHMTEKLGEKMVCGYSVSELVDVLKSNNFVLDELMDYKKLNNRYFNESSEMRAYENIYIAVAKKATDFNESYYMNI